jgi:hypothetical protein
VTHIQSAGCKAQKKSVSGAHNRCWKYLLGAIFKHGEAKRDVEFIGEDKDRQLESLWRETRIRDVLPWEDVADEAQRLLDIHKACRNASHEDRKDGGQENDQEVDQDETDPYNEVIFGRRRPDSVRESVLFIGTQFSNLYTVVDTSAMGRVVVCLVFVCLVFVCKHVLGHSWVSQPLNLRLYLLRHLGFLTSPYASPTCRRRRLNSSRLLRRSTPAVCAQTAVMARRRRRRRPGGHTTAVGSGGRRAPISTDTASHTHTTHSLACPLLTLSSASPFSNGIFRSNGAPASLPPACSSLTHARRMDGFCYQNADQLGSLAGPSLLTVYVGVVECASASPYTYSSSTHRFPDERTPIEAAPLSWTSAELGLGLGLGLGLDSFSHSSSHAPLLLATLLSHTIPFPCAH